MTPRFRGDVEWISAARTRLVLARGNAESSSAKLPVTKGVATLVPSDVAVPPSALRLVTRSPGAPSPRLPIEPPKFERLCGRPLRL